MNYLSSEMSKGRISFEMVRDSFKEVTSEGGKFYDMMNKQSETLSGKISNFGDSWEQLKVKILNSQSGILKNTVDWASKMVTIVGNSFENTDKMEASFRKYGAKDYSFMDKLYSNIPGLNNFTSLTGGRNEMVQYQDAMQKNLVNPAMKDLSTAMRMSSYSQNMIANMTNEKLSIFRNNPYEKAIGMTTELDKNLAIAKGAHTEIQDIINAFKADKEEKKKNNQDGNNKNGNTLASVAAANRPTQYNIHIDNLVRELQMVMPGNTPQMTLEKMAELVSRILLGVVNDVSVLPATK